MGRGQLLRSWPGHTPKWAAARSRHLPQLLLRLGALKPPRTLAAARLLCEFRRSLGLFAFFGMRRLPHDSIGRAKGIAPLCWRHSQISEVRRHAVVAHADR